MPPASTATPLNCYCSDHARDLYSFPTRRSSDLAAVIEAARVAPGLPLVAGGKSFGGRMTSTAQAEAPLPGVRGLVRSEEHTSELQSHSDLVCRLLLEKKKGASRQRAHGGERLGQ